MGDTGSRVLVTGGSGFIGRRLVRALLAAGHDVTVVDKRPFPGDDAIHMVQGDLLDQAVVEKSVAPGTEAIFHLAAITRVLLSVEDPAGTHALNVTATAALLEQARLKGAGTFILASTNAVTGDVGRDTITEDIALRPLTPYGATKAAGEMLLSGYHGAYGLRTPALRLTNVYGPGMRHKDSFIPRLMRAAAEDTGVSVYGDGLQVRDLVHVSDVARAFALAVAGWPSGPVIIGSGASHTVLDLVDAARQATGCPIPVTHVDAKPGEMPAVVVDNALAQGRGFVPEVSLVDGIRSAWADFAPSVAS